MEKKKIIIILLSILGVLVISFGVYKFFVNKEKLTEEKVDKNKITSNEETIKQIEKEYNFTRRDAIEMVKALKFQKEYKISCNKIDGINFVVEVVNPYVNNGKDVHIYHVNPSSKTLAKVK